MPQPADTGANKALTVSSAASLLEKLVDPDESQETAATESSEGTKSPENVENPQNVENASEPTETGDEPAEEEVADGEEAESEPVQPRKFRVKVDGAEQEVTEDELLKGYSRHADYTRKTQALSEKEKTFEAEQAAVRSERQAYAQRLALLEQNIKSLTPDEPNWDDLRKTTEPAAFAALYTEWSLHKAKIAEIEKARHDAEAKVAADFAAQRAKVLDAEKVKMVEAIPEWKDTKIMKADRDGMLATAKNIGFSESDLDGITDHRLVVLLRKAHLYDQLQAKKPQLRQQLEEVRSATPGTGTTKRRPVTEVTRAKQRLAQTGRVADAAKLFELMDA